MSPELLGWIATATTTLTWAACTWIAMKADPLRRAIMPLAGFWGGAFAALGLSNNAALDVAANGLLFGGTIILTTRLEGWLPFVPFKSIPIRKRVVLAIVGLCFASRMLFFR